MTKDEKEPRPNVFSLSSKSGTLFRNNAWSEGAARGHGQKGQSKQTPGAHELWPITSGERPSAPAGPLLMYSL